jgi:hypothetical protein
MNCTHEAGTRPWRLRGSSRKVAPAHLHPAAEPKYPMPSMIGTIQQGLDERCLRNRARAFGKNGLVRGQTLPITSLPLCPFAASCACVTACLAASRARRAPTRKARPTSVSWTRCEFLSKSFRPISFRDRASPWLKAGCEIWSRWAARRKLSSSATATK